jgi:hypothetical protein
VARQGKACLGKAGVARKERRGYARQGVARQIKALLGRQGKAWCWRVGRGREVQGGKGFFRAGQAG